VADDPTAVDMIAAIYADAQQSATDVSKLLAAWAARIPGFVSWRLSEATLLKLGALLRIRRWELAGVTPHLRGSLPSSTDVLRELLDPQNAAGGRAGRELALTVMVTRVTELAWDPLDCRAAVVVGTIQPCDLADALSDLLWRFRHLSDAEE
jgi:hypothetical protein